MSSEIDDARARIESLETALREVLRTCVDGDYGARDTLDAVQAARALLAPQGSPGESGPPKARRFPADAGRAWVRQVWGDHEDWSIDIANREDLCEAFVAGFNAGSEPPEATAGLPMLGGKPASAANAYQVEHARWALRNAILATDADIAQYRAIVDAASGPPGATETPVPEPKTPDIGTPYCRCDAFDGGCEERKHIVGLVDLMAHRVPPTMRRPYSLCRERNPQPYCDEYGCRDRAATTLGKCDRHLGAWWDAEVERLATETPGPQDELLVPEVSDADRELARGFSTPQTEPGELDLIAFGCALGRRAGSVTAVIERALAAHTLPTETGEEARRGWEAPGPKMARREAALMAAAKADSEAERPGKLEGEGNSYAEHYAFRRGFREGAEYEASHLSTRTTPGPDTVPLVPGCAVNPLSSRCCSLGTKACVLSHRPPTPEPTLPEGWEWQGRFASFVGSGRHPPPQVWEGDGSLFLDEDCTGRVPIPVVLAVLAKAGLLPPPLTDEQRRDLAAMQALRIGWVARVELAVYGGELMQWNASRRAPHPRDPMPVNGDPATAILTALGAQEQEP